MRSSVARLRTWQSSSPYVESVSTATSLPACIRAPCPEATVIAVELVPVATVLPAVALSPPKMQRSSTRSGLAASSSTVAPVVFTVAGGWR